MSFICGDLLVSAENRLTVKGRKALCLTVESMMARTQNVELTDSFAKHTYHITSRGGGVGWMIGYVARTGQISGVCALLVKARTEEFTWKI
jgi:hypothetical protein